MVAAGNGPSITNQRLFFSSVLKFSVAKKHENENLFLKMKEEIRTEQTVFNKHAWVSAEHDDHAIRRNQTRSSGILRNAYNE